MNIDIYIKNFELSKKRVRATNYLNEINKLKPKLGYTMLYIKHNLKHLKRKYKLNLN